MSWISNVVRPKIQSLLMRYVRAKLYTDKRDEQSKENRRLQEERFKVPALPYYVLLSPDDKILGTFAFTRDVDEFARFLESGLPSDAAVQ